MTVKMKKYDVLVTETTIRTRTESVLADSANEAEDLVHAYYDEGCYGDDYWDIPDEGGVEFDAD